MTGEVTLQGRVLPIGGVKQKVLAAQRAGLTTVILPVRNGPDLEDVPEAVRDQLTFHLVEHVSEVLDLALGGSGRARRGGLSLRASAQADGFSPLGETSISAPTPTRVKSSASPGSSGKWQATNWFEPSGRISGSSTAQRS